MNLIEPLHVVSVYFNPLQLESRRRLFLEFQNRMNNTPYVVHDSIQVAYRGRVESLGCRLTLHTDSLMYQIEAAYNAAFRWLDKFSPGEYLAFVDADLSFSRYDWASEAIKKMKYGQPLVQLFSNMQFLGPDHRIQYSRDSFAYTYKIWRKGIDLDGKFSPGFGWAFTRDYFQSVGGLLDCCILGGADFYMAVGASGLEYAWHNRIMQTATSEYQNAVGGWQRAAHTYLKNTEIGYVDNCILHHWHGSAKNRNYLQRHGITDIHKFNPCLDIKKNDDGLWEFTGNKPEFEKDVLSYFEGRQEDAND